jgi:butyryl-CoA dehydrogenase
MDLLGRKVTLKQGRAFSLYISEVKETIAKAGAFEALVKYARALTGALDTLQNVTSHLMAVGAQTGPEVMLSDATLYLEFFGIVTIAWQWLLQGIAAQKALQIGCKKSDSVFYEGKMFALRYFFAYELPKINALMQRLTDDDRMTVEMAPGIFDE